MEIFTGKRLGRPRKVVDDVAVGKQIGTDAEIIAGNGDASGSGIEPQENTRRAAQRRDIERLKMQMAGISFLIKKNT